MTYVLLTLDDLFIEVHIGGFDLWQVSFTILHQELIKLGLVLELTSLVVDGCSPSLDQVVDPYGHFDSSFSLIL